jgi:CRP-like cAMP-binding protein
MANRKVPPSAANYDGGSRVLDDGAAKLAGRGVGPINGDGVGPNGPTQNLILAKLPPAELAAFTEVAEKIDYEQRVVLFERGSIIPAVFFPVSAMISLLTVLSDGTSIEAVTIGYEGVAGLQIFHGVKSSAHARGVIQIGGEAYRVPADRFVDLLERSPVLTATLHKYAQFTMDALAQGVACNSIHLIEQRCARWLLLSSDAIRGDNVGLTQEFFAQMLAVRRSGVTTAMGALERKNLITTRYGKITIIDRDGLTKITCECYNTVAERQRELLS